MAFIPRQKKWLNILLLVIGFLVGWLLGDIPIIQDNKILIITVFLILLVIFNIRETHPIKQKAKKAAATTAAPHAATTEASCAATAAPCAAAPEAVPAATASEATPAPAPTATKKDSAER